jgi:hypothetical protein
MGDKNPNPQGKGQVVLLKDLESYHASNIRPKNLEEISQELFTALFILHSDCNFNAIPEQTYHLYRLKGRYQMMLLGPDEWFSGYPGDYWGACTLQQDLSWSLELSETAKHDDEFQKSLLQAQQDFQTKLEASKSLHDALPFHIQKMPYHQRVLAFALSKSLDASMELAGYAHLSYREARKELKA